MTTTTHTVIASDFASLKDLEGYRKAKSEGKSDTEAFKVGDNGEGCWGDNTAQLHTPMCALPPETIEEKWGTRNAGKHKRVRVQHKEDAVICLLGDVMPHIKHITNGCRIDLNPATLAALHLTSPFRGEVQWSWVD